MRGLRPVVTVVSVLLVAASSANATQSQPASGDPKASPRVSQGLPTATGQHMGPLFLDRMGADFTAWLSKFRNEVYKNWIWPAPALMGLKGHGEVEFTVKRDGSLSQCRILVSSGNKALDTAAKKGLTASRFPPLPSDYSPKSASMRIRFSYNEAPSLTRPSSQRSDATEPQAAQPQSSAAGNTQPKVHGVEELRLPPGLGQELQQGTEGSKDERRPRPSIASSLRDLDRRLQSSGPLGLPSGTGQQYGPLFFDPMGADFTVWLNHFKNEIYSNWIQPQAAQKGTQGRVDVEFTVDRDGSLSQCRILMASGTPALDKAATNSLESSRFLPLPDDYHAKHITMRATFFYNEGPATSPK